MLRPPSHILTNTSSRKKENLVVFTVLTGAYTHLNNPFLPEWNNFEKICFTDDTSIEANGWMLAKLDNHFLDPARAARRPKLMPHLYLSEFEWSLYIDTTVKLRMKPTEILRLHANQQIKYWCFQHPWRNCIYEEAEEVIRLGYDDQRRVREQIDYYSRLGYPKNAGLCATGILLRKHNDPAIVQLGEIWFEHVLRFSKRDQLSFNFVARQLSINYGLFEGQLTDNQFILWPGWPGYPEGQRIPADFDDEVYEWLNPEVRRSGLSPRKHYMLHGMSKGLPYKRERSELDRLANKYKTEKGSLYYNAHAYAAIYERHFASIKDKPLRLLELGLLRLDIQTRTPGGSYIDAPILLMWQEYFPNAEVIGFDIADFSGVLELPRCRIVRGDISNPADLLALTTEDGFDIIIDAASHASHHQQIALSTLFPFVKEGGFYVIEDLNNQPPHLEPPGAVKTKKILRSLCRGRLLSTPYVTKRQLRYLDKNAASIEFYDSFDRSFGAPISDALVIIQKRQDLTHGKDKPNLILKILGKLKG